LDEINLAAAETLECLSGLLEGSSGSLVLLDRGDTGTVSVLYAVFFFLSNLLNSQSYINNEHLPL